MSKILIRKEQEKSSTAVTAQCRKATIGDEKRVERYPKALAMLARIPMSICWTLLTIRAGYPFWMLSTWNWTLSDMLGCKVDLIEEGTLKPRVQKA